MSHLLPEHFIGLPFNFVKMDPTPPTSFNAFVIQVFRSTKSPVQPDSNTSDSTATETDVVPSLDMPSSPPASVPPPSTESQSGINQSILRHCLNLASSFLVTDLTTNPESGITSWLSGFNALVDVVVALHARSELEIDTLNAASKACSECWTAAGAWRGMEGCREGVRGVAGKLRKLLDEGGRTYRGEPVYAP